VSGALGGHRGARHFQRSQNRSHFSLRQQGRVGRARVRELVIRPSLAEAPKKSPVARPADRGRAPALPGSHVRQHAGAVAPWRACVSWPLGPLLLWPSYSSEIRARRPAPTVNRLASRRALWPRVLPAETALGRQWRLHARARREPRARSSIPSPLLLLLGPLRIPWCRRHCPSVSTNRAWIEARPGPRPSLSCTCYTPERVSTSCNLSSKTGFVSLTERNAPSRSALATARADLLHWHP